MYMEGTTQMAIHDFKHSFSHLADVVLPAYMIELRKSMSSPKAMADFSVAGIGIQTLLKQATLEADFAGCYVMLEKAQAIYVGISRGVFARLRQHVMGRTHFDASLAYRMAKSRSAHKLTRSKAMEGAEFQKHFNASKTHIRSLNVAYVPIDNPLVLYIFEAYAAMELDTALWNTFATH
jgi:hypothetical protein